MSMAEPDWIDLLRSQQERGKSIAEIAREIGMPRPSVSLLISGKYPASLSKVTQKYGDTVRRLYQQKVPCPHLGKSIEPEDCARFATAPMTMSNPKKLQHWRACQSCSHNTNKRSIGYEQCA